MAERQSIIRNFQWLAGINLAVKPLWLFFLFYSARLLGPVEFGKYVLAISYVSIIYSIIEGGIDIFTVREISSGRKEYQKLFPHTITLKTGTAIFTFCLAAVFSYNFFSMSSPGVIIIYASVYIAAYSLMTHVRYIFRAHEILKYEALSMMIEKILVVCLCFIALSINKSALLFMGAFSLGYLIALLITIYFLFVKIGLPKFSFEWKYLFREVLFPALPYAVMTFLMVVYARSATVMLKLITGEETLVGYYNAGYRIVEAFILFPSLIIGPLYPVFVRLNQDKNYVGNIALKAVRIITVVSLGICLIFMILRNDLTLLLYGSQFLPASNIIIWLTVAMIPIGFTWVFGSLVAASGRQSKANVFIFIITAVNILGNYYFISNFGLTGAVGVTIFTETAIAAVNVWIMKDYLPIEILSLLLKFFITIIVFSLLNLLNVISGPFLFKLSIILLLLLFIYFIFKLITLEDIKKIISLKN